MSKKTGVGGDETNCVNSKCPVKNPIIPVISIPRNKAPLTFQAINTNVINKPANVNKVIGSCKLPNPTMLASLGMTIPDIFKHKKAINKPIPDVIPNFKDGGIAPIKVSRSLV